ncbi:hypothetical protein K402DRAFT_83620 [Aulographum hederae CBS 113979]|uniref:Uncharacterized protein n=1 Tax=Aulographum hederae CBS 113979 TaxID=1176131 RepID=A0A6G1H0W2_9PEZI|nr:hypothetical protein K402DRAFT_83620 [Aulographum hederae CBS 113979]
MVALVACCGELGPNEGRSSPGLHSSLYVHTSPSLASCSLASAAVDCSEILALGRVDELTRHRQRGQGEKKKQSRRINKIAVCAWRFPWTPARLAYFHCPKLSEPSFCCSLTGPLPIITPSPGYRGLPTAEARETDSDWATSSTRVKPERPHLLLWAMRILEILQRSESLRRPKWTGKLPWSTSQHSTRLRLPSRCRYSPGLAGTTAGGIISLVLWRSYKIGIYMIRFRRVVVGDRPCVRVSACC